MSGTRYRLVTTQDSTEHISSVVLSRDEAVQHLIAEGMLHRICGWQVWLAKTGDPFPPITAKRGRTRRHIRAQAFEPMEDGR